MNENFDDMTDGRTYRVEQNLVKREIPQTGILYLGLEIQRGGLWVGGNFIISLDWRV